METPWTTTPECVLQQFGVDPTTGLSPDQVRKHSEKYGTNGTPPSPATPTRIDR